MSVLEIGCCGAYCKTCRAFRANACRGCKLGYADGARDFRKARCGIKVCCMTKGRKACADCADYDSCPTLQAFYQKPGYKYLSTTRQPHTSARMGIPLSCGPRTGGPAPAGPCPSRRTRCSNPPALGGIPLRC